MVPSAGAIFDDASLDVALIFTPPFTRRALVEAAVASGKRIITTKPLAPNAADARAIVDATRGTHCLVIYKRTGNAQVEAVLRLGHELSAQVSSLGNELGFGDIGVLDEQADVASSHQKRGGHFRIGRRLGTKHGRDGAERQRK